MMQMDNPAVAPVLEAAPLETAAYCAARRGSAQWRVFLKALAMTFDETVETADAHAFLREVGAAMARSLPLPRVATLEALEDAMNARWDALDWGWVRLREADGAVAIVHGASPTRFAEDAEGHWTRAAVPVLEGVYGYWFQAQQGPSHLQVKLVAEPTEPLVLRYGR